MLQRIIDELEARVGKGNIVEKSDAQGWMKSEDADTLGATYAFLCNPDCVRRVSPLLSFDEVFVFMLHYYEFCLRTDPKSQWANSRYSAGWELTRWFVKLWHEKREVKYFQAIKSLLERLYITGDRELKTCIEHAIVEHLFEIKAIRDFCRDWRDNVQLQTAYEEGMLWISAGGSSPLSGRNSS